MNQVNIESTKSVDILKDDQKLMKNGKSITLIKLMII